MRSTARLLRCLSVLEGTPDVRLLAAADGDLRTATEQGRFRQDLYYRLSAFSLELPPLREHKEDIYLLAGDLIEKIRQRYGIPERFLSGGAFSKLMNYDWPGNIRLDAAPVTLTLRQQLKQAERRILQQTLAQCGGWVSGMHDLLYCIWIGCGQSTPAKRLVYVKERYAL